LTREFELALAIPTAIMSRLWVLFDRAEAEGSGRAVSIADQLRKLESDLGAFDSSLAAARVHVSTDETALERFLLSVREPLPPDALKVMPLLEDGEFATYRELPPSVRGDG
jgi:hypothetical protein